MCSAALPGILDRYLRWACPRQAQWESSSVICAAPTLLPSGQARLHIARLSISIRSWSRRRSQAAAQSPSHARPPTTGEESLWRNLAAGTGGAPHTRCDLRRAKVVPKVHAGSIEAHSSGRGCWMDLLVRCRPLVAPPSRPPPGYKSRWWCTGEFACGEARQAKSLLGRIAAV